MIFFFLSVAILLKVRGEWRHVLKGEVAVTQYGETAV